VLLEMLLDDRQNLVVDEARNCLLPVSEERTS
jgi:hypothetical protein